MVEAVARSIPDLDLPLVEVRLILTMTIDYN